MISVLGVGGEAGATVGARHAFLVGVDAHVALDAGRLGGTVRTAQPVARILVTADIRAQRVALHVVEEVLDTPNYSNL